MTDIADVLPKESQTVQAIYAAYKRAGDSEPTRGYLGASIVGHACDRYLWFCFRQCFKPEFSGRMYRLFETGDLEEARFVKDLRDIGCTVHEVDEHGKQWEVSALGGHFSGHMDAAILGVLEAPATWHNGEFKTHNAKSFAKLQKEGVKSAKPMHYAQMQVYMHLAGLTRSLYLARNKDNDELYAERVRHNKEEAESLIARARRIILSSEPPARLSDRADYWECKCCDARTICHGCGSNKALSVSSISCRQCCHATADVEGTNARWVCERLGKSLAPADQDRACENHLCLPGLFQFATVEDYDNGVITFKNANGQTWRHGMGGFSSAELLTLPTSSLGNGTVEDAKRLFDAEVTTASGDDILSRYPESDCRVVWMGPAFALAPAWKLSCGQPLDTEKEIAHVDCVDYEAWEFESGRVAIDWRKLNKSEIREGKE